MIFIRKMMNDDLLNYVILHLANVPPVFQKEQLINYN